MNICVISDINLEPHLSKKLHSLFNSEVDAVKVYSLDYNEIFSSDAINKATDVDIAVVWLDFEYIFYNARLKIINDSNCLQQCVTECIKPCKMLLAQLNKLNVKKIFWFSFCGYFEPYKSIFGNNYYEMLFYYEMNHNLLGAIKEHAVLINKELIIGMIGIDKSYDMVSKYRWNNPYSKELIQYASNVIYKQYQIHRNISKKVLILDCDNVLWDGILSEDGIEKIQLDQAGFGRKYYDFQCFVKILHKMGVILAICSKNDLSDVLSVFHNHNGMILKEDDIACFQVNWEMKSKSIKQIADTLHLGLDSFVFVDDSPLEIEEVRYILPEVTSLLFDPKTIYQELSCFNLNINTDQETIQKRNDTYKTDILRQKVLSESVSWEAYMNMLKNKITIDKASIPELSRISELSQRTNRYTNNRRYDINQIKQCYNDKSYQLFTVYLQDIFGDLGLIGVIGIKDSILDLFCLSCRALGRCIENEMIDFIKENLLVQDIFIQRTVNNTELCDILCKSFSIPTVD